MNEEEKENYWKEIVDKQIKSGVAIAKWCDENNISISNFCRWKKRVYPTPTIKRTFTPLKVVNSDITIKVNGVTISINKELLPEVIKSLKC